MNRPGDDDESTPNAAAAQRTVLDRIGPTVVRRRVYEPAAAGAGRTLVHVPHTVTDDDDDSGPPSSVNVARALASLRGDELRRLEEIVRADDDPVPSAVLSQRKPASVRTPPAAAAPAPPAPPPTLRIGPTITLADLASGMGMPKQELVTALVTRGFFSMTVKTVLPRDTARIAATLFGWTVEDDDAIAESAVQSNRKKKSHAASPSSSHSVAAKQPKPSAPKKPGKQRSVQRGR